MGKKEKKVKTKISAGQLAFQIINTLLVIGILGFYIGRLFYFKDKMEMVSSNASYEALAKVIIARNDLLSEDRLYENEDGSYVYKGNITNNYVEYCGQLFRVVSIDADGNIKAIANSNVGSAPLTGESAEKAPLYTWLNEVYEMTVDRSSSLIARGEFNYSSIDDYKHIEKTHVVDGSIGLLTLDEYITAGGPNSFLNFGEAYWLGNNNSEGVYYFVDETGSIGSSYSESLLLNVRPVIFWNYTLKALSGEGTIESPYILEERTVETVRDCAAGDYVTYADRLWKVCNPTEDGNVIMIADSSLKNGDDLVQVGFGEKCDYNSSTTIYKYLHSKDLGIANEDYLAMHAWPTGPIDEKYDYRTCLEQSTECLVGIPSLADMYLNGGNKFVLATKENQSAYMNYAINDNLLYTTISIDKAPVRPIVAMKGEIKIVSGSGSLEEPYALEVIAHE